MIRRTYSILFAVPLMTLMACGPQASQEPAAPESAEAEPVTPVEPEPSPQDAFWANLTNLCGQAFAGRMTSNDEVDADFADQVMTMHVRRCADDRLEIPFHVGENRSRTWVLTRTDDGLKLQHDHRHEDGGEDAVTLYGGSTAEPGEATVQLFPVDEYSKELFVANGLDASVTNVWSFEIDPGQRFSYVLRRPERHFQADFDLTSAVPEPPAPWGFE
ncbi:MAG: hypothetical protein AAGM22_17275 [Acidobacteriota bacterium]